MTYLLDTNVWVALLRKSSPEVAARFQAVASTGDVRVCSIIALANACTLVTHNAAEFSRVPGLAIEDWQNP